jgi:hypothetical protein
VSPAGSPSICSTTADPPLDTLPRVTVTGPIGRVCTVSLSPVSTSSSEIATGVASEAAGVSMVSDGPSVDWLPAASMAWTENV